MSSKRAVNLFAGFMMLALAALCGWAIAEFVRDAGLAPPFERGVWASYFAVLGIVAVGIAAVFFYDALKEAR